MDPDMVGHPARVPKVRMPVPEAVTRPGFEGGQMPLARRLPKRGFRNIFRKIIVAINIEQLNRISRRICH